MKRFFKFPLWTLTLMTALATPLAAEDGYQLWLRYAPLEDGPLKESWRTSLSGFVAEARDKNETMRMAAQEIWRASDTLLEKKFEPVTKVQAGSVVLGTPKNSKLIASLKWDKELTELGSEGFLIRHATLKNLPVLVIASAGELGCLYGAFHLARLMQMGQEPASLNVSEKPRIKRRLLNHWDNLDGSIERGYAGKSLWNWAELPEKIDPRYWHYALNNASVGINGTVLNNVNTNPAILRPEYLAKLKAIADAIRPLGMRVYLSVNFGTPKAFGETATADPFDPAVKKWWKKKTAEVYKLIPDFGGFLVKANSEGQPGPLDYGRTHADGANMLAKALKPHGGILIWRAFVYNTKVDRDRVKRAYLELMPFDAQFDDNVFIQTKNGALDYQPREPFHPLFGGLKQTKIAAELQITQEYLGHSTHLAYLGPMWQEFFASDTFAKGPGSLVSKSVDGSLFGHKDSLIAGVANTGSDRNWCGHDFAQANWYSYGRLAWNPDLRAEDIADEWIRQTWSRKPAVVDAIRAIMLPSRQAVVDYSSPLGLAGVFERDIHYAPDPGMVDERHDDWSAAYFVRADKEGLGYNRSPSGSNAAAQYQGPWPERFSTLETCPEEFLLWFHHVPWQKRLKTGNSLWEELKIRFARGVKAAEAAEKKWKTLKGTVDEERHAAVAAKLKIQSKEAAAWAEKSLKYYGAVMNGKTPGHPFGPEW